MAFFKCNSCRTLEEQQKRLKMRLTRAIEDLVQGMLSLDLRALGRLCVALEGSAASES